MDSFKATLWSCLDKATKQVTVAGTPMTLRTDNSGLCSVLGLNLLAAEIRSLARSLLTVSNLITVNIRKSKGEMLKLPHNLTQLVGNASSLIVHLVV